MLGKKGDKREVGLPCLNWCLFLNEISNPVFRAKCVALSEMDLIQRVKSLRLKFYMTVFELKFKLWFTFSDKLSKIFLLLSEPAERIGKPEGLTLLDKPDCGYVKET